MKKILQAIVLGLALSLVGCAGFQPIKTSTPTEQMTPVQRAQQQINEANALLTAINQTIAQRVKDGSLPAADAQRYLDRSKVAGKNLDTIQAAIRAGSGDFADPAVQLQLIRQLEQELLKRVGG